MIGICHNLSDEKCSFFNGILYCMLTLTGGQLLVQAGPRQEADGKMAANKGEQGGDDGHGTVQPK